jgi:hypothetical protein
MVRIALLVTLATGCTSSTAPKARAIGKVVSLGGVIGVIGSSALTSVSDDAPEVMAGFALVTVVGMLAFAAGELTVPHEIGPSETIPERNHRWARILTERAAGAARDGRCPRVRRLEVKVRGYDREVHDFVFMRDPEILKCLSIAPESISDPPADP